MTEFANVPLPSIVASLTNPRKTFNPITLAELAEDIKAKGVHTPVILRPLPGTRVADTDRFVEYELVAGERRYRASGIAGLETIPALISPLTDSEALEIQLTENVQRDDLTDLEEAEGLAKLMEHSGLTADAVADRIKKSRRYVFDRLKLLDLSHECKEAMRAGQIDISRAIRIARIPNSGLQSKALAEATRPIGAHGDQVLSVRAFESWLRANVMLPLDGAPFQITDARLVKAAGNCKECPKRTGANPELFADVDGADICTDPICYHSKADAHRAAMVTKAEAKGMRLIEGKEAKEICHQTSGKLDGYLPLSQLRQDAIHLIPEGSNKVPTLRDLLGKDAPAPVLIENPHTKELIEAVPTAEAEAMLVVKGLIKATQQQAKGWAEAESEIEYLQKTIKAKTNTRVQAAVQTYIKDCVRGLDKSQAIKLLSGDVLRAWFIGRLDRDLDPLTMADLVGYKFADGTDEMDSICMHIRACPAGTLIQAMVLDMIDYDAGSDLDDGLLKALERTLQVNTVPVAKKAAATVKAETASQIKALQDQLKATTAPAFTTPPETFSKGEGGEQGKAKTSDTKANTTPSAARNSKTKISAAEATSGIAAAMQGIEDQATTASPDEQPATPANYDAAVALVRQHNKASISMVQRHLKVGYNTAARLLDQMEAAGVINAMASDGTRTVLPAPAAGFAEGQRITVSNDAATLGPIARKWAGRDGVIAKVLGDDCYQVKLSRGGSVPMYANQLQAVVGAAA